MALNEANIKAVITAEDRASAVLGNFGKNVDGVAGKIGSALKIAAEGLLAATAAVTGFATLSLKAYTEHEEQLAQLNQVLSTTGKVSQISSKQVEELALSMERYSGKSHDAIVQGQVLLLQFSQTTSKNLPEMTKAMLDLSQRMGVDTVTAAKQLGIALDSPTTGMARLRRSGIDFTEAQKEAIKALEKSGKIAEADALLMKALEEKVGGAAGAYRNTLGGAISSARASLKDFEETVGGTIAKYLEPLATKAALALSSIDWQKVIENTIKYIKDLWREVDNLWQSFDKVYQQVEHYLEPKLEALLHSFEKLYAPVKKFVTEYITPLLKVLGPIAGQGLVWAIGEVIDALNLMIKAATIVFEYLDKHKGVVEALAGAFGALALKMALGAAFDAINIGFATMQLITIPALMTSLGELGYAFGAALPYMAIAAFVVWFAGKMNEIKNLYNDMNKSITGVSDDANRIQTQAIADFKAGKITKEQEVKILQIAQAEADSAVGILKHRAGGGPVTSNSTYMVGEKGPELFIPNQSGTIIPNNKVGGNITIQINAGALMGSDVEARKFAQIIVNHIKDIAASKTMTVNQVLGI